MLNNTIKKYSYDQAKKLGVIIKPSKNKNKKIDVFDKQNNFITSIGDSKYGDYPTFILTNGKKYADKRRKLYKLRHESNRHIIGSTSWYADNILW